ncbi:acetoacetyl-CoA synthetase-like [Argiope bruennichi]|uniref:acetoacetyl-CoA synthetase-like n=1 Tax=Argiope bruennichi TaxID=94029 RepID=UPI002494CBA1|nr:acetoacetyl-CoA synthetase-like [Argiope bruennichi]
MATYSLADVKVMWKPDDRYGKAMKKFKKIIEDKYNVKLENYWDLHEWSINHIPELWAEMWDFAGVICSKKYEKIIDLNLPLESSPEWFQGAKVNVAENYLKYRDDHIALILTGEGRESETVTYAQLYKEAELYAAAFRKSGLKKGDVVVCQMSNRKEAVIAMIAVLSIGAVWAAAVPMLGATAALNRFAQVGPKCFITVDRIPHEKKIIDMLPKTKEIAEGLPTLEKVVIVEYKEDSHSRDISDIKNGIFLKEFLELGRGKDGSVPPMQFEQVSFTHPVFINYTSGTTGLPKAVVHGPGFLLATFRDMALHIDIERSSISFTMSPAGWVSWNIITSSLFFGPTLLLFEGSPYFLSPTFLWDLVDEYKLTHMLIPTSILDEYQNLGYVPREGSLESLKVLFASGSVVKPQIYDFVYENIKKDFAFSSAFGSTEMMANCMIPEMTLPIHKGEIPAFSLGVAIETLDDNGQPVLGEIGEIVISKPIPNLPLGLWGDDGSVYREKYFSTFPGKFTASDYGIKNPFTKGLIICCRSDETLKQRGTRFGSSEIYNVVDTFPEVRGCLCVAQYSKTMDERAVLFVRMKEGHNFNDELVNRIREAITRELTAAHVPDVILETKDIPYNVNGKKLEIVVKKIINNKPFNLEVVTNPESLKNFYNIPELQGY